MASPAKRRLGMQERPGWNAGSKGRSPAPPTPTRRQQQRFTELDERLADLELLYHGMVERRKAESKPGKLEEGFKRLLEAQEAHGARMDAWVVDGKNDRDELEAWFKKAMGDLTASLDKHVSSKLDALDESLKAHVGERFNDFAKVVEKNVTRINGKLQAKLEAKALGQCNCKADIDSIRNEIAVEREKRESGQKEIKEVVSQLHQTCKETMSVLESAKAGLSGKGEEEVVGDMKTLQKQMEELLNRQHAVSAQLDALGDALKDED